MVCKFQPACGLFHLLHDIDNNGKIQRYLLREDVLKYFNPALRKSGFVFQKGAVERI
jgi:hypothetical protein